MEFMEDSINRYKYLLVIILIFLLTFGLVGLLFNLVSGFWYGLAFALLLLIFFSKWGEKIVLIFAKARYVTDDEALVNQVKNFCAHLNMQEVKVYWSNVYINNLYFTNSYLGEPALVIGKNVYRNFSRNELNSLIHASLLRIKSGEAKHRTMTTLIFFTLYSPVYALAKILPEKWKKGMQFFFYPAFVLKSMMYEKERELFEFDQEVGKMSGLKKEYISALFKLAHLDSVSELSIGALMLGELSHARNSSQDPLSDLLINNVDVKLRIKNLNANN
jgi:hypothetical protein